MGKISFRTYFNKDSWSKEKGTINNDYSLTDQSFKSMCEIEQLLVNYRGTPRTPVYDMEHYDTSKWTFEDWQNEKAKIERKFLHLTDEEKERFGSPANFFRYCSNPNNYEVESVPETQPIPEPKPSLETPPQE